MDAIAAAARDDGDTSGGDDDDDASRVALLEARLRASHRYNEIVCARFVDVVLEKKAARRLLSSWRNLARDLDRALHVAHEQLAGCRPRRRGDNGNGNDTDGNDRPRPPPPPRRVDDPRGAAPECCICFSALGPPNARPQVLVPCGHARFCAPCVAVLRHRDAPAPPRCPLCRTAIETVATVRL